MSVCAAALIVAMVAINAVSGGSVANALGHPQVVIAGLLSLVFDVLVHLILLAALLLAFVRLVRMALQVEDGQDSERMYRMIALASGALVAFGSKATGVSIPSLLVNSTSAPNPILLGLVGVAVPAATGYLFCWYLGRVVAAGGPTATRIVIFAGTLIIAEFADVYTTAVGASGFGLTTNLLPNVSFLVAAGIRIAFGGPEAIGVVRGPAS